MNAESEKKSGSSVSDSSVLVEKISNRMSSTKSDDKETVKVCQTCCTQCNDIYSIKILNKMLVHCTHCSKTPLVVYMIIIASCCVGTLTLCQLLLNTFINIDNAPGDTEITIFIKSITASLILVLGLFTALYFLLRMRNVERARDCVKEIN